MKIRALKRIVLIAMLMVAILMSSTGTYAGNTVTMYAPDGRTAQVKVSDAEAWKAVGWHDGNETIGIYAPDGRTMYIFYKDLAAYKNVGWYDYPVMYVYAMDGRTIVINSADLAAWKAVGWYETNTVTMYAPDGRKADVKFADVEAWKNVGWYTAPVVTVYNASANTMVIAASELNNWRTQGWDNQPVAKLYSADGRTIVVPLNKVHEYSKVGWYTMVDFMFKVSSAKTKQLFGPFNYELYYPGVPNSGDLPRTYYTGGTGSPVKRIATDNYSCCYVVLRLVDAFPYLAHYANADGNITLSTLNSVLGDSGIYGKGYRSVGEEGAYYSFTKLKYDDDGYWGDYNRRGIAVDNNGTGYINIYSDLCHFNDLT